MTTIRRLLITASLTIVICVVLLVYLFNRSSYRYIHDWAEGKAITGDIAVLLCEYAKEKGENGNYPPSWEELFGDDDFFDKEPAFRKDCFSWQASYDETLNSPIRFLITVTAPKGVKNGYLAKYEKVTLDHNGVFECYPQKKDVSEK